MLEFSLNCEKLKINKKEVKNNKITKGYIIFAPYAICALSAIYRGFPCLLRHTEERHKCHAVPRLAPWSAPYCPYGY